MRFPAFVLPFACCAALAAPAPGPCVDFYQYACGAWLKDNPIPPDQSRWGRASEVNERNRATLRDILEQAARPGESRAPAEWQIGDYYAACMDEAAIERKGLAALREQFDLIRRLSGKQDLAELVARLHRAGVPALFDFNSVQDFKDATEVIAQADQGGLGLPDRDYYLRTDARSEDLRKRYVAHVERVFTLAGRAPAEAKAAAAGVMEFETALARGSLDRVSQRDPSKVYHRMDKAALQKLSPAFAWPRYFAASGAPAFSELNVSWPEFFQAVESALGSFGLERWKTYLEWHLLHSMAPLLPQAFIDENFEFYGRALTGAKQLKPRWRRCVDLADQQLGESLGRIYVERTFGAEGKRRMLEMVHALEKALGDDIDKLPWMTPETRARAREKLKAITNKIGYPERWRDYSSVEIRRDDAVGNAFRADRFEFQRQLDKIGKPVDRLEWFMTPPTVNAYYDPQMNNINFPAGILQPPFFDRQGDDAMNFGAIGAVIGHELTHGFDDEGRQFDAQGNLRDWWSPSDAKEFEKRAACFERQYSEYEPVPGARINGKLTLGENAADNGGVRIALMALVDYLDGRGKPVDGMTPEQRFFLGYARIWCQNQREESTRLQLSTDPHSPGQYRVNGVLRNMPEFRKAFSCGVKDPMVAENACRVW